jgi:maleate isomerase
MSESIYQTRGSARLGIVVPTGNTNLEPDMMMLAPNGISLHFARAGGYDIDQIPDEKQMQQYSDTPASDVIDSLRDCRSDIILYGCTSATLAQGPEFDRKFRGQIETIAGVPAVTAASALVEVLNALEVRRFAFSSPYVKTLNSLAIDFIESFGMHCVKRADVPVPMSNEAIGSATPEEITTLAERADCETAEAMVISCTDYRATEAIPAIEARLGKPVVTSNQAMMLMALKRLGIAPKNPLLEQHLATARIRQNDSSNPVHKSQS